MEKDFNRWNERKKKLDDSSFNDYVHEREVWWCAIGANIGVESNRKHSNFERPALVIRKFSKDAVVAVPVTTKIKDNPYYITYTHDGAEFAAMISQVRLISTKRLIRKVFSMDSGNFLKIRDAVIGIINKRSPQKRGPRRPHGH